MNKTILVVALSSALVACGGSGGSGSKEGAIVLPPVEAKAAKLDQETSFQFAESVLFDNGLRNEIRSVFNMHQTARNAETEECSQGGSINVSGNSNDTQGTVTMQFNDCKEGSPVVITSGVIKIVAEDKNKDGTVDYASASYHDFRIRTEETSYGVDVITKGSLVYSRQSMVQYQEIANTQIIDNILNETIALENVNLSFNTTFSNVVPVSASGKVVSTKHGSVTLGFDSGTQGVIFTGDNSKLLVTKEVGSYFSTVSLELDTDNDALIDHKGESDNFNEDAATWLY